jgi:hypothetical protein
MKNLGVAIDRLIKIDPNFEQPLLSIKSRWKRYPSKAMACWKELLDFLNTKEIMSHPKRTEMKSIITPKPRAQAKKLSSFEEVCADEQIVGTIPEDIECIIRQHDKRTIQWAKDQVEANMTHNVELMAKLSRQETLMDITTKRFWLRLKDHFNLWSNPSNFCIKKHGDVLVVTEKEINPLRGGVQGQNIVKMDPNTLRQFMKFLGLGHDDDSSDNL